LYGLKQASRHWFAKSFLKSIGFIQSSLNNSLFIKNTAYTFFAFLAYVDDIIIIGDLMDDINNTKKTLEFKFKIKDLG